MPLPSTEDVLIVTGILLLLGILASKLSSRLGVPALLLFLLLGMLAGSEGPGGIPFDDPMQAQFIGVLALAYILFSGGLETSRQTLGKVMWQGLSLSTLGVLLTALLVGGFAHLVLGFTPLEGFLLGAIVSSTDAAAVFSILRSQSIGLKGHTRPLLELESGSNDPMAVFLTLGALGLITQPELPLASLLWMFVVQMALGALMGVVLGRAMVWFLNRVHLESDGLYPAITVAGVLLVYGLSAAAGGNGFLAVYLAGMMMNGEDFIHKRSLVRFHDAVAWLMQMTMFLTLGLLVFPSRLLPVAGGAILVALFLMLVGRPVAVFASLLLARLRLKQKVLISWVGLRGAVPIVLATFPYGARLEAADAIFNVVFFTVLLSVLLQGTTISRMARLLKLDAPLLPQRRYPLEYVPAVKSKSDLVELEVKPGSPIIGKRIMDLAWPDSALVVLISRGEDFLAPRGATMIEQGDSLLVLTAIEELPAVRIAMGLNGRGSPEADAEASET